MITDREFWLIIRRALAQIAHALHKRYGWVGLCIVLGLEIEK